LQIVAPDMVPEAIPPKLFRPPEDWRKRGQMSRLILGVLRTAKAPMTTREIAAQMILERGLAMDDRMLRLMTKRVAGALGDQREKGRATSDAGLGTYQLWTVAK